MRNALKIFKPELLGNAPFAGGHRTPVEVVNGKLNDIFSSISDVDHARGSFDLVKLYPAVATADQARFQDAHIFVSDEPDDELVSTLVIEAPALNDTTEMAEMRQLLAAPDTRYHGVALTTAEASGQSALVEKTQTPLLPVTQRVVPKIKNIVYRHSASTNGTEFLRQIIFEAPTTNDIAFFSFEVPDLFTLKPYYRAEYYGRFGGMKRLEPIDNSQDAEQLSVTDGVASAALQVALGAGNSFYFYYYSSDDYRYHQYALDNTMTLSADEAVVPGTWRIKKAGDTTVYTDNGFGVFYDSEGAPFAQGNYETGELSPAANVDTVGTQADDLGAVIFMRNATNQGYRREFSFNVGTESFVMNSFYLRCTLANGSQFSVSATDTGEITHANINGTINANGDVSLSAATGVDITHLEYDIDWLEEHVMDADWLHIDPNSLPNNGRVSIFHVNNIVRIQHHDAVERPSLGQGDTVQVLKEAAHVELYDKDWQRLYTPDDANFSYDKTSGLVTINAGISSFTGPFTITSVQSELVTVDHINDKELRFLTPLTRTYPAGSRISSAYVLGDLQALPKDERTIAAWQNDFGASTPPGSASLNTTQYPIEMTNLGAINQRWAVVFDSETAYRVIGEHLGVVYSGDILNDCIVMNPFVQAPYFIIRKEAFGAGLLPGEAFLFETLSAAPPIMVSRAVNPGHSSIEYDKSTLSLRGNRDSL
ncbi:PUTATIVE TRANSMEMBRANE PROTEIN [Pseudoalteromonas sp. SW0106-04]|uniref:hypothetical protein n=1 Tax=Pseudoalteromonas sp. SW0106-04 TaxID=1702169 RepID=UPI0006B690DC|nr:hypothetical protein [Pseudoalteromonas sp. SW0106-04]GAP76996.1 PUTATIVE TRANSMEMBRANE PROTEIN [Pseudoalteromonas sp. SW0106-04]